MNKPEDKKKTQKQLTMDQNLTAMDTNGVLRAIWQLLADKDANEAAARLKEQAREPPRFSDTYDFDPFARSSGEE